MLVLNKWLQEKRQFSLIFADLDSLKYINDQFGHNEGDAYIINAAKHLRTFSPDAVVCRIGGDEFMLLISDMRFDQAQAIMSHIYTDFKNDEYLTDKEYVYSISFGIVAVDSDNTRSASEILSSADERMYEDKRMHKRDRLKESRP